MGKSKKTRVYVLSGFLGAGKTTLLKRILSWEIDLPGTVVVVNEFGDVGIDKMLLEGVGSEVFELSGGCICCTQKNDLKATLKRIQSKYHPNRILIEATGVADPAAIMETLEEEAFQTLLEPGRVITILEADYWDERENFGSFFQRQLNCADLILLNKVDRLPPDDIPLVLDEIRDAVPHARILPTVHCNVDQESFWMSDHPGAFDRERNSTLEKGSFVYQNPTTNSPDIHTIEDLKHSHDALDMGFVSFSFQENAPMDETCFGQFINSLPWELFRVKGLVRYRNRTVMVNSVGGKTEWRDWTERDETQLAFVGLRVNAQEILDRVRECICHEE